MKRNIIIFILFDILLYFIIFLNYIIYNKLTAIASSEFNSKYIFLSILINSVLFIIIGLIYSAMINQIDVERLTGKYSICEFIVIGINSLFISSLYIWTWLDINFLPSWLISNSIVTSNLGSILFGLELYRLIRNYKRIA